MEIKNTAKELLARYLKAVSRHLPLSKRGDIPREIESLILDICEERYSNETVDDKKMESILVELGKPSKLAAKYKEEKPLIGPELMPIFKLVLLIVCLVTAVVSLINFALGASGMTAAEMGLYFLELFNSITGAVGTIFIIFIILERAIKNKSEIEFDDDTWKIADLPEITEKIPGRGEIIATIIFSAAFIVVLNIFFERIGIYYFEEGDGDKLVFIPVLTSRARDLLPLFSLRIALGAVTVLPLITANNSLPGGRRTYYQLSQMGLAILDIGILILLLSLGAKGMVMMDKLNAAPIDNLAKIVSTVYTLLLAALLVVSGINIVKRTLAILPKGRV